MANTYDTDSNSSKSSAELELEVEAQRNRVEARIGEIKDRLSPGQLVDELLSYTKHGGAEFASNLGHQLTANPLPAALVGVGLAWLISSNVTGGGHSKSAESTQDEPYYPYAKVGGSGLRRVNHSADEEGQWWSEFETDTGSKYKARSNEMGERAGHFVDETGKMFSGFIDETGNRVTQFKDSAGNMLGGATGWASHSWRGVQQKIREGIDSATSSARHMGAGLASGGKQFGGTVQNQTEQMSRQIAGLFDSQPLIAGALAFAAGAALGATLPHTAQEDRLVGRTGDKLRSKAGEVAGDLYEQGKERAAGLYDEASEKAGQIYSEAKDKIADLAGSATGSSGSTTSGSTTSGSSTSGSGMSGSSTGASTTGGSSLGASGTSGSNMSRGTNGGYSANN